jgi:hypothetical protein
MSGRQEIYETNGTLPATGLIAWRENHNRRFVLYGNGVFHPGDLARGNDWGIFEIWNGRSDDRFS